jgi:hypothetical protein
MKTLFITVTLLSFSFAAYTQPPSKRKKMEPTLSYKDYNKQNNPSVRYVYDAAAQTHNYSGNWDFDGDGRKDKLFFIGNGGAHIYFQLKIVLSSDKVNRDFPFLLIDMPYLGNVNDLKTESGILPLLPQFVVYDFDEDGRDEVYINIDNAFTSVPEKWVKRGVTSRYLLLDYKNRQMVIKDYEQSGN